VTKHEVLDTRYPVECVTHPGTRWLSRWPSQKDKQLPCPPNVFHDTAAGVWVRQVPGIPGMPAHPLPSSLHKVVKDSGAPTGPPRDVNPAYLQRPERTKSAPRFGPPIDARPESFEWVGRSSPTMQDMVTYVKHVAAESNRKDRARREWFWFMVGGLTGIIILASALLLAGVK
jgi:hypothetical protein